MKPFSLKNTGLLFFATLAVSACGSSKENLDSNNSSGSNSPYGASVGKCSIDMSNQSDYGMKLQAYEDSQGLRSDLVSIEFIRIPSQFGTSSGHALQLWTRTISQSGTWGQWQNVRFYIAQKAAGGNGRRTQQMYQDVTWSSLQAIAQSFGVSVNSPGSFFSQFHLVAQLDAAGNNKIITASMYLSSNTQRSITALAPIFDANPNNYQKNQPQALVALHPLQAMIGSDFSNQQFESEINSYCIH